jgi:hypothetical protein
LKKKNTPGAMNGGQVRHQSDEMARPGSNGVFFFLKERKRRVVSHPDFSRTKHKKRPTTIHIKVGGRIRHNNPEYELIKQFTYFDLTIRNYH